MESYLTIKAEDEPSRGRNFVHDSSCLPAISLQHVIVRFQQERRDERPGQFPECTRRRYTYVVCLEAALAQVHVDAAKGCVEAQGANLIFFVTPKLG